MNRAHQGRMSEPVTFALRGLFDGVIRTASKLPHAQSRRDACAIEKNVVYSTPEGEPQRLDVIRARDAVGPQPALLYIHGGGFAVCNKETHEIVTYQYAQMGFTVFSIDYRLTPEHRFPAAFHDACAALLWVMEEGANYGADVSRIVVAGESAGGNLALAVTVAAAYRDDGDEWAARVFDAAPPIVAAIPACGVLQVSGMQRFWAQRRRTPVTRAILASVQREYLPPLDAITRPILWADPLLVVERKVMDRPLPPTFTFCGTRDVLVDDTRRLGARLASMSSAHRCVLIPGQNHAFHAMVWRPVAQRLWAQQYAFLIDLLPDLNASWQGARMS